MFFLYLPFMAFAIMCKAVFWIKIIWRQKSPLSRIPGPWWASLTRLWLVKNSRPQKVIRDLCSGQPTIWYAPGADLCVSMVSDILGSLARIGPKNLITSDPATIKRILGARSQYTRGPWFDSIKIDPHVPNIVSERDVKKHNALSKLAASVSTAFGRHAQFLLVKTEHTCSILSRTSPEWSL